MELPWRMAEYGPQIRTSLTAAEARELQLLAKHKLVLEIGAAYGYSTVILAWAADKVISVDPHQALNSLEAWQENVRRYEVFERVDLMLMTSDLAAREFPNGHFDFVFVDGDHSFDAVKHDAAIAHRLVKPYGGVIAFHDYGEDSCPGVKLALREWRDPDYVVDTLAVYNDPHRIDAFHNR